MYKFNDKNYLGRRAIKRKVVEQACFGAKELVDNGLHQDLEQIVSP